MVAGSMAILPANITTDNVKVNKITLSGAFDILHIFPRLNLRSKRERGNRAIIDSQVKAKLKNIFRSVIEKHNLQVLADQILFVNFLVR